MYSLDFCRAGTGQQRTQRPHILSIYLRYLTYQVGMYVCMYLLVVLGFPISSRNTYLGYKSSTDFLFIR